MGESELEYVDALCICRCFGKCICLSGYLSGSQDAHLLDKWQGTSEGDDPSTRRRGFQSHAQRGA
jgi:hypothetical protein